MLFSSIFPRLALSTPAVVDKITRFLCFTQLSTMTPARVVLEQQHTRKQKKEKDTTILHWIRCPVAGKGQGFGFTSVKKRQQRLDEKNRYRKLPSNCFWRICKRIEVKGWWLSVKKRSTTRKRFTNNGFPPDKQSNRNQKLQESWIHSVVVCSETATTSQEKFSSRKTFLEYLFYWKNMNKGPVWN